MPDVPMRYIHFDVSSKESYSLDSVGKHGFGRFLFPQRNTPKNSVLLICVVSPTCSHGDWPPASWRGEVKYLHSDEIGRAAHARLGPFLQLRCNR